MSQITHREVVLKLAKPGDEILETLTPSKTHLMHMAIGLIGELVELQKAFHNNDLTNIIEELGDMEFYLQGLYHVSVKTELPYPTREAHFSRYHINNKEVALRQVAWQVEHVVNTIKKHVMYCKRLDIVSFNTELNDLCDKLDILYAVTKLDRDIVIQHNIHKLYTGPNARYAGGYTDAKAEARADKQGKDNA